MSKSLQNRPPYHGISEALYSEMRFNLIQLRERKLSYYDYRPN